MTHEGLGRSHDKNTEAVGLLHGIRREATWKLGVSIQENPHCIVLSSAVLCHAFRDEFLIRTSLGPVWQGASAPRCISTQLAPDGSPTRQNKLSSSPLSLRTESPLDRTIVGNVNRTVSVLAKRDS